MGLTLEEQIKEASETCFPKVVQIRRHLHANPELSFKEFNTSAYIGLQLDDLGISWEIKAETGIVALLQGKQPGKVVALRADIDALPIQEKNTADYKSTVPGVMHACGHDVHTSSLLGTASILSGLRSQFNGTVKLIFQPGEEKVPGGASLMIAEGVLKNPVPMAILGQHVLPQLETGKVGFRPGKYMASADELYVTVRGKGGHGAMPNLNIDPVLIASHLIVALQQIVSRNADPKLPTVLSFGRVIADGATNVIPDSVYLEGTFRTLDEKWRAEALAKMKKLAEGLAESMGGTCEFNILRGYPFLVNDEDLTHEAKQHAINYLGADNVVDLDIWMAAEDFAFYTQQTPACFYRLGTRNEAKGIVSGVHTPTFDVDEQALKIGPGLMAYLAIKELGN